MAGEMQAARGAEVTYETVRRWAVKFGQACARRIRALGYLRVTNDIWTKWWSPSTEVGIGCGAL